MVADIAATRGKNGASAVETIAMKLRRLIGRFAVVAYCETTIACLFRVRRTLALVSRQDNRKIRALPGYAQAAYLSR